MELGWQSKWYMANVIWSILFLYFQKFISATVFSHHRPCYETKPCLKICLLIATYCKIRLHWPVTSRNLFWSTVTLNVWRTWYGLRLIKFTVSQKFWDHFTMNVLKNITHSPPPFFLFLHTVFSLEKCNLTCLCLWLRQEVAWHNGSLHYPSFCAIWTALP